MKQCIKEGCEKDGIWTPHFHFYPPAYYNYTGPPITMGSADGEIVSCEEHKLDVVQLFNSKQGIDGIRKLLPPHLRNAAIDPRRTKIDWIRVIVDDSDVSIALYGGDGRRVDVGTVLIKPPKDPSKCLHCQGEPTWTTRLTLEDVAETHKEEVVDDYQACDLHYEEVKAWLSPERILNALRERISDEMKMPRIEWIRIGTGKN
jgi:hypothetical protein